VIVREYHDRLLLITQPDHAHLAARVMEHCVSLDAHPRRDAILHAIAEHDNGWAEEDASPSVDPETGAVVDFVNAPLAVRHRVWPRAVARLERDAWSAALVAQHAIIVYERFRPDPQWAPFFAEMTAVRDEMVRRSSRPLRDLEEDYAFVRLADLISLTFCAGWNGEQRFGHWRVRRHTDRVLVTPDPFGGRSVAMDVAARRVRKGPFSTDAELREALISGEAIVLRGRAVSAS
jgi:hypothetical protein